MAPRGWLAWCPTAPKHSFLILCFLRVLRHTTKLNVLWIRETTALLKFDSFHNHWTHHNHYLYHFSMSITMRVTDKNYWITITEHIPINVYIIFQCLYHYGLQSLGTTCSNRKEHGTRAIFSVPLVTWISGNHWKFSKQSINKGEYIRIPNLTRATKIARRAVIRREF